MNRIFQKIDRITGKVFYLRERKTNTYNQCFWTTELSKARIITDKDKDNRKFWDDLYSLENECYVFGHETSFVDVPENH